jgi:RNA recognition motif-containing protein
MSTVVRLRGLPFETTEADLINFFTGLSVVSSVITHDLSGRPSGEGFVTFCDAESARAALSFDRQHLGRRYVEVFESDVNEMSAKTQVGYVAAQAQHTDCILRMRGLPFDCTAAQVVEFFSGFSITEHNVTLGVVADGKFAGAPSGEGWVQFPSSELAAAALRSKNKQTIGGSRYVELFPSTAADRDISRLKPGAKMGGGRGGMFGDNFGGQMMFANTWNAPQPGEAVVKMRGLPFSCTPHEVVEFFAPEFPVRADQVNLPIGADGRPSGQGFVTFSDRSLASRAVATKNRQYMGSRYIELSEDGHMGGGFEGDAGVFGGGPVSSRVPESMRASPYDPYGMPGGWGKDPWAAAASDPAVMGMFSQLMTMMKGGGKGSGW